MRSTTIALALLGSLCLHATAKPPAEPPTEPQHRPQLIELAASGASMQAYELGCSQLDELAQESRLELDKAGRFEFALIFTNALAMELAMSRDYAERLAALRDRPALRALPLLTAQLEHCRAQHLLRLGEGRAAAEIYDRLGAIQDVWMLGPLDNERGAGFRRTLPAEREAGQRGDALELDAPQRGKARELRWRRLDVGFSPARQFDFDALVRPNEQVLSLLMFAVRADTATPIAIRIGSGGSTTVRINGQQILERDAEERDFGFDQDQGCYVLSPGWNLVMVKTGCQEARYQLRMRMTSPSGELLPPGAVTISAKPEHLAEARKTAPSKESRPASALLPSLQLLPELQNASQLQGEARRAAAELAYRLSYLLNLADRDDESKRRDRALARLATELAPDWGAAWHLYGEALESGRWSADRDDNARFAAFERAVQTWPRALIAMLRLSMMELEGRGNRHKAVLWLERARAVQPRNRSVVRQELELFRARGMRDEYVVELRRALTDTQLSQDPELLDMAIAESIQEDRILEPLELARRRLALRNDPATHIRIASLLRRQGKYDEAKSQLETALALYPWDYDIFNALSQLHVARKDYRAAERSWSEYLELCPEEDHVWLELADLAARRGDRAAQISCLERALELRPGLSERARQLEYLQANEKPFYAGFELDGDEIIRKDEGASNRAKVDEESHEYLLQHTVIRAYADGTASRYEHLIARILNERGAELLGSYAAPFYGGSQTARILQARVIDPKGGERRARVGRSYYVNLPPIRPGDIVEIKARVDDRWPGFFGDYFGLEHVFVPEAGVGSKRQRLDVLLEQGREYYFQRVGGVPEAKERILQDGTRLRTWEMRHVASYDIESLAPSPRETGPLVRISTYRDWNQFAAWWWDLIRKQTTITPPIRARVQQLVQGVDDPEEKLRRIYEFVTNQVRYKAWEFGVHGYKPYSVDAIYARLHGDCKDKAILMNAMLSEVGIEAYPVLIEADERRERDDLSLPLVEHFNHCISYVPAQKGMPARFLDGTAEYHPLGVLPEMDYGAEVLVVRGHEGQTQRIEWPSGEEHQRLYRYEVQLAADGSAEVTLRHRSTGFYGPGLRSRFDSEAGKRRERLEDELGALFGRIELGDLRFSELSDLSEAAEYELRFKVPELAKVEQSGTQLRFEPIFRKERLSSLATARTRRHDMLLSPPSSRMVEVHVLPPKGWEIAQAPKEAKFDEQIASFVFAVEQDANGVRLKSIRVFRTQRVPAADYPRFREFARTMEQAESQPLILKKVR